MLERHNRKFVLTPAGEHFYKKSLVLIADYEQMCSETAKIARGDEAVLKIGYLRSHNSPEVHQALAEFSARYPRVDLQLLTGTTKIYFICCAPEVQIWCSTTSAGRFRMSMST